MKNKMKVFCPVCSKVNNVVISKPETLASNGQDAKCGKCGESFVLTLSKGGLPLAIAL